MFIIQIDNMKRIVENIDQELTLLAKKFMRLNLKIKKKK